MANLTVATITIQTHNDQLVLNLRVPSVEIDTRKPDLIIES